MDGVVTVVVVVVVVSVVVVPALVVVGPVPVVVVSVVVVVGPVVVVPGAAVVVVVTAGVAAFEQVLHKTGQRLCTNVDEQSAGLALEHVALKYKFHSSFDRFDEQTKKQHNRQIEC